VPVQVEITNRSAGADTYQWTFEGATATSSSEKAPAMRLYLNSGIFKITLTASNKDGSTDTKTIDIQIDAAMKADISWELLGSDISPVTLQMLNTSLGATSWQWEFQGGEPAVSTDSVPLVRFAEAGEHTIKLSISNGKESYSDSKTIMVQPAMTVDFDWTVDAIDTDYQAPVTLHLHNFSTNAHSYQWTTQGATPAGSSEENPDIVFPNAGNYTIVLTAANDKENRTIQKQVSINEDKNLLTFPDVHLGINTAQKSAGCFFSSILAKVIKSNEVTVTNGSLIDFAYFGLNDEFNFNRFLSPDEVQTTAFTAISGAIHTKIVNLQDLADLQLTVAQFDKIDRGDDFKSITVTESNAGRSPFDNSTVPRIVLFQTGDGRKGAVKITNFTANEKDSYITVTIKVQKQP
jgi:PKD repeat protein